MPRQSSRGRGKMTKIAPMRDSQQQGVVAANLVGQVGGGVFRRSTRYSKLPWLRMST